MMPRIDSTYFGSIIIDGKKFKEDLILTWDGEISPKRRTHSFTKRDLMDVLIHDPEVLIIGTGAAGSLKVDPEVEIETGIRGIELIVNKTNEAANDFNKLSHQKRTVAVLHATC